MAGWHDRKADTTYVFYTETQVMQFLAQHTDLDTGTVNHCEHRQKEPEKKMYAPPPYPHEKRVKNHDEWMEYWLNMKDSIKKKEGMTDLIIEINNERLEGSTGGNASLVFDIMVSCDHDVYFNNCLVRLSYNTGAFGANVEESGNISVTRGPAFTTRSYYDPDTMHADIENDLIAIPFGVDFNQHPVYNRTLISPTPTLLMTVALNIQHCNKSTEIEYTDVSLCNIFSSYTVEPGDTIPYIHDFDTTYFRGGIDAKTCVPEITGFTNEVPAGLGKTITVDGELLDPVMTIQGNYFGTQQHTGCLFFKDANQLNVYPEDEFGELIGTDDYDIISWDDDEIILKLPSILDGTTEDQQHPVPGSGEFKVMNFTGYEYETSGLTIPYALYQVIDDETIYKKSNVYLSNQNDSGGYTISFDQSVQDFSLMAKKAAKRAIHDWNCATLVNWAIGEDNMSHSTEDGICTIFASD
jgi:hypothetical protein